MKKLAPFRRTLNVAIDIHYKFTSEEPGVIVQGGLASTRKKKPTHFREYLTLSKLLVGS